MGEVPLSLHVTEQLKRELEQEAERQNLSAADVAQRAIRAYLDGMASERDILRQRMAEADKGVFISEEAMLEWMDSWDTDEELPPPEPDVFLKK